MRAFKLSLFINNLSYRRLKIIVLGTGLIGRMTAMEATYSQQLSSGDDSSSDVSSTSIIVTSHPALTRLLRDQVESLGDGCIINHRHFSSLCDQVEERDDGFA